ncbi:hypothetical protein RF400_14070, partial [Acinetobacter baumannii]|nr:hypothetical protein [Acinetobacter baumannii]
LRNPSNFSINRYPIINRKQMIAIMITAAIMSPSFPGFFFYCVSLAVIFNYIIKDSALVLDWRLGAPVKIL